MAPLIYLFAIAALALAALAGLAPDRLPTALPAVASPPVALVLVAGALLALGRIIQLLERLDRRLVPTETIANRLVEKTEDFDRWQQVANRTEPTFTPDEDDEPAPVAVAPASATRTPAAPPAAASAPVTPPVAMPSASDLQTEALGAAAPEPAGDEQDIERFEAATPEPQAPGEAARHRGRDVVRHADGTISARTIAGWRRFRSLEELDDYIGPQRTLSLIEGFGRTG